MVALELVDISRETFGKYQYCTMQYGLWYSDDDFSHGGGCGHLRFGAVPSPCSPDRRPWRGLIVEGIRRLMGAKREK